MEKKSRLKLFFATIGLIVLGGMIAFFAEDFYRQFVRFIFKLFNGENIQFVGKNVHLFASKKFMMAFGVFCALIYLTLKKRKSLNAIKGLAISVVLFFATTILISWVESQRLIIECTACKDGVRNLNYNELNYDLFFLLSLSVSILALWFAAGKRPKDPLIGFWTREDDGSGLLAIIGWSLNFEENNFGAYDYWDRQNRESFTFDWERLNENTIRIKPKAEAHWTTIQYKITAEDGAYHSRQLRLCETAKNGFWNSPEPLFRRKLGLNRPNYQTNRRPN